MMKRLPHFHKTILMACLCLLIASESLGSPLTEIEYNSAAQKLSVKANNAKLEDVFGLISERTGVWIHLTTSLEKTVTIELHAVSLETALKRLTHGYNHALIYEKNSQGGLPHLVGMEVLGQAEAGANNSAADKRTHARGSNDPVEKESANTRQGSGQHSTPYADSGKIPRTNPKRDERHRQPEVTSQQPVDVLKAGDADTDMTASTPPSEDQDKAAKVPNVPSATFGGQK